MAYLLDSDVVIDYLGGDAATRRQVDALFNAGVAMSVITYMEVYQGVLRDPDPVVARMEFEVFLAHVPVAPLSEAVARQCAELREELRQQGKRVRTRALDLLNAATALNQDLALVTRNVRDYRDISGLALLELDSQMTS